MRKMRERKSFAMKNFEMPDLQIVEFSAECIMTVSAGTDEETNRITNETPIIPGGFGGR